MGVPHDGTGKKEIVENVNVEGKPGRSQERLMNRS